MNKPCLPLLCLLLGPAWSPESSAQTPPPAAVPTAEQPAFPTQVELVTVDAVVVDKRGQAVPGFAKDDFVITENGRPQAISSFEAVTLTQTRRGTDLVTPPRESFSTNEGAQARQGRTFVVVFDDIHLSATQAHRAKAAVGEFLNTAVAPGDVVTLVATAGSAWWTARMPGGRDQLISILKRLDGRFVPDSSPDRITEYEAMRIEVYQDEQMAWKVMRRFDAYGAVGREKDARGARPPDATDGNPGMIPSLVRQRALETYQLATSRNKITLRVMERAIQALAGTRGRKAMILVSQGFIFDIQLDEMKDVVDASRRVNAPIYFVDTRGLQALPEAFTAAFGRPLETQDTVAVLADMTREAEGSEAVALDTGGFVVKNSNDITTGMARVSSESRTYYLLGYNPTDLTRDGKFRKIEVKLLGAKGKGVTVRARRGYYAPRDGVAAKKASGARELPDVVRALDSPYEIREVPLRVTAYTFDESLLNQLSTTVVTEIDIRGLGFTEAEGRSKASVAFLIEAQHRETGEYYRYDQTIEMSLLPETRERLARTWYQVPRDFALPPGGYQAKVVVREMSTGRIGSVIHEFEVPAGGGFRVSTPILSDALDRSGEPDAAPKPVLRVRPAFPLGATLYCQFAVFGATKEDTGSLMPRVSSSYEIRRTDGRVFKRSNPTRINPTTLGALLRLNGISLAGAEPGDYEIVLQVKDELADRSLEVREPFVIEARASS